MRHRILFMLILMSLVSAGCSKRVTRQFIVADIRAEGFMAGDWMIMNPSVVAFKDVINLESIADTTMFWISMKASRARSEGAGGPGNLIIDSVKVTFLPNGDEYWRKPTRDVFYGDSPDKYTRKVFDFFGDQGIVIPSGVDSIRVDFDAFSTDEGGDVITRTPITVQMVRNEKMLAVPLLQE